jgi:hypothetical protein
VSTEAPVVHRFLISPYVKMLLEYQMDSEKLNRDFELDWESRGE